MFELYVPKTVQDHFCSVALSQCETLLTFGVLVSAGSDTPGHIRGTGAFEGQGDKFH